MKTIVIYKSKTGFTEKYAKWKLKIKKQLTPDEKGMLSSYDRPVDFTRKKNIDGIITYVNPV
ncbi:hypothetical protein K9O30_07560 [Clostridium bowmanii]|uniref:hypothetical protein n=1 Tax=Clostridium bowmanii TaxID=132925 RepID=UPI001C0D0A0D|nr:hypothetical protein [Clostridium bowmanii]MBU3189570.1 hypothetical protein [Clostridium bowmanii]MCA1073588.1 hypothetical protein [Clostridium bowmanii]